jgi:hypothetical protein
MTDLFTPAGDPVLTFEYGPITVVKGYRIDPLGRLFKCISTSYENDYPTHLLEDRNGTQFKGDNFLYKIPTRDQFERAGGELGVIGQVA